MNWSEKDVKEFNVFVDKFIFDIGIEFGFCLFIVFDFKWYGLVYNILVVYLVNNSIVYKLM